MLSGILFMFILFLDINWIVAVNMCTNGSTVSTVVTLNLLNGTGVNGCYCSVKLHNAETIGSDKPKIIFEVKEFSGCKYKLVISYYNTRSRFSCNNTGRFYHDINKTDEIKLYLESTSYQDDTTFEVKITSRVTAIGGPLLRLECFLPNTSLSTTTTSSQSSIQHTASNKRTTTTLTPDTASPREVISSTVSTARSTEDMINSTDSSTKQEDGDGGSGDDIVTAGIIGGVIGVIGGVMGSVLIFIIIRLVKKKRKKKSTSEVYSSPSRHHQPESQYTDLQLS